MGPSLFIPEQSKVRQTLSSLFANSIKGLLIQSADYGMYFHVFLMQTPSKIFRTLANETLAGKILKAFVCKRIVLHIDFFLIESVKNVNACIIKLRATVKKFAIFLDLSAKPEMSITVSQSRFVFSPKPLFTESLSDE